MTEEDFKGLKPGTIVRGKSSGLSYVVTGNYGGRATAVRTVDLTNPDEWDVIPPPESEGLPASRGP